MKILGAGKEGRVARALAGAASGARTVTKLGRPQIDLTDAASIDAAIEDVRPDVAINPAAYAAVDQAETDEVAAFVSNAKDLGDMTAASVGVKAGIGAIPRHLILRVRRRIAQCQGTIEPCNFNITESSEIAATGFAKDTFRVSAEIDRSASRAQRFNMDEYRMRARRSTNLQIDWLGISLAAGIKLPCWQASARADIKSNLANKGLAA